MAADERDVPVSQDYAKSTTNQVSPAPPGRPKLIAGVGVAVVLVVGGIAFWSHMAAEPLNSNPLSSHAGFDTLRKHVESLAEVDGLCSKQDRLSCFCELSDRIRADRQAIDSLLANDPELRNFQISVRRPASVFVSYDLTKLPKPPEEAECLNAVAAPTIIDDGATDADGASSTN